MGILWAKSGDIARDNSDVRAVGAKAYFYAGGTTTPLTVYQEAAESTPHNNPVVSDSNGRWPTVFIPYTTTYDVKITTSGGTQLSYPTNIPNPDPVEAAASTVGAEEIFATGDLKCRHLGGSLTGFVRCNGRTMGSASSGGTERAHADTSDLYAYLWNGFANSILAVTTGRGATAAADFAANKAIALPDMRSGIFLGVDDMGNSAASRAASIVYTNGSSTTAGSHCGANTHTISEAQLPSHTHTFSATTGAEAAHTHTGTVDSSGAHTHTGASGGQSATHTHAVSESGLGITYATGANALTVMAQTSSTNTGNASVDHTHTISSDGAHTHTFTSGAGSSHTHSVSGTTGNGSGSGTAHNIVQYGVSGTWYMKL